MFLKSIFVMVYIMGAMFFNFITMTQSLPRTTANLPVISFLTLSGAVLTVIDWLQNSQQGSLPLILGVTGVLGWSLYLFWYSRYGGREGAELRVGNPLPEFVLQDEQGNTVNSRQFLGNPALLFFTAAIGALCAWRRSRKSPLNTSS